MTVDDRTTTAPTRLTLRLAAALLMEEGVLSFRAAKRRASSVLTGNRDAALVVNQSFRPLVDDKVVERIGDYWYAHNLGDLAAWIADGAEAREAAGIQINPPIPGQRTAA